MARSLRVILSCMLALTFVAPVAFAQPAPATAPATTPATQPVIAGPSNVLDAIPDDAWGFVLAPDMQNLSNKLTSLGMQLGLPVPPMLPMAKMATGLMFGVEDSGGLALVVANTNHFVGPPLALLVPTADHAQLLQAMAPQDAGDGVQQVKIANEICFVAPKGRFMVVAPSKAMALYVANAKTGVRGTLAKDRKDLYDAADLLIHADLATIIPAVKPMLMPLFAAMEAQATPPGAEPTTAPAANVQAMLAALEQMTDGEVLLTVDPAGLLLQVVLGVKAESDWAKQLPQTPLSESSLLVGLPAANESVVLAAGQLLPSDMAMTEQMRLQQEQAFAGIFANPQVAAVVDKAKAEQLQKLMFDMLTGQIRQYAISISALSGGDAGLIGATKILRVKDTAATLKGVREAIEILKGMFTDPQIAEAMTHLIYKPEAEKIADLNVDHLLLDMTDLKEVTEEDKAQILKAVGKDGFVVRIAPVGKEHIVITFGGGAARFESVVALVKAGKAPLAADPNFAKAAAKLPAKKNAEIYLSVDNIFTLVKGFADLMQQPLPFQLSPVGVPIAMASTVHGQASRADILIPIEVISAVKDLVMQAMMPAMGPTGEPETAPAPATAPTPNF